MHQIPPYSMKCTRYPLPYSVKCTRYLPPILYEMHQVTSSPIEINQVLLSPLAWTKPGTPVLIVWNALDTPCIVWNAPCTPLTNNMKCTRYPYAAWNAPGIPSPIVYMHVKIWLLSRGKNFVRKCIKINTLVLGYWCFFLQYFCYIVNVKLKEENLDRYKQLTSEILCHV
jgi:hypothetical protein